jgi:hypothetical protein
MHFVWTIFLSKNEPLISAYTHNWNPTSSLETTFGVIICKG